MRVNNAPVNPGDTIGEPPWTLSDNVGVGTASGRRVSCTVVVYRRRRRQCVIGFVVVATKSLHPCRFDVGAY